MNAEGLILEAESRLIPAFALADAVERACFARVLQAFHTRKIGARHFAPSNGYGYGDDGRDAFEKLFADAMGARDALVRPGIASGTHALTVCLFALLRPGQTLLYASGAPYDTLHGVIGVNNPAPGTLADWGIGYRQIELLDGGMPDLASIENVLRSDDTIKLLALQRSRGYSWRPTLTLASIEEVIRLVRRIRPDVRVMVDNCYGEFACECEPCSLGADAMVGSLIKNPGGGLAPTGGYIVGSEEVVELCAARLTAPNLRREIGSWQGGYQPYYQGLYMAPHAVCQAMKGAMLASAAFALAGYRVSPALGEARGDIIQAIELGSPDKVIAFCRAIQASSPIDAHVTPEPWPMPGYDHDVIMAAGTFVGGASIELSADAPMREPYIVYLQGALTYEQARLAVAAALEALV
jgi:cystathionine beta-lyase family protein involved in aluminum resistance